MPTHTHTHTQNPESHKHHPRPAVESLLSNPDKLKDVLASATPAELDSLEKALSPVMARRQKEQSSAQQTRHAAFETKRQTLLTFLSPELENFKGDIKDLKAILNTFCTENNLMLLPTPGAAIAVRKDVSPDWQSQDGKYAVKIMPDAIILYKKTPNGLWMPSSS